MASAPKWTYYRSAAHHPDLPAGAQGCGRHSLKICAAPATKRPPLHIAAAAVRCLPKLETARAHVPPSAHGVRIPARCARAGPDDGPRAEACCLGAVRSLYPPRRPETWRAIHPPTPGGRYFSPAPPRLAPDARRGLGVQPLRTNCRGAGRPRRPNRPPRPRVAVQAMADGSPGGGRARLVGTLQVGSDMYFYYSTITIYNLKGPGLLPASAEGPGSQIRAAIATHRSVAAARAHLRGPCLTWGGCHGRVRVPSARPPLPLSRLPPARRGP